MMITYPTLSKEIFLWRLQLLWTLVLTLTCAWFIICSNTVVSSKSQLRRCGRLAVWALPAEILDKSYSDKCQPPRKHLDGREKEAISTELFCIPPLPWIVT